MPEQYTQVLCGCGEHQPIDIFKEHGMWIALCHTCEKTDYDPSRYNLIKRWEQSVINSKNSVHVSDSIHTEIQEGMERWIRNIHSIWVKEYGQPMLEDDQIDLVAMFAGYLEDISRISE